MNAQDKVNILLVDDQPQKLLTYESILAPLGENLIHAESAPKALEILLRHDIALMVVDVVMPEMDGFELARAVRSHPRFQETPIIFVTAISTSPEELLQGYGLGAMDYVCVPIVPETLRAKVSVFVNLHRTTRAIVELNRELEQRVQERTEELQQALLSAENHASRLEREIAERERIERALRSSEERFRLAVESAPSGMILSNEQGSILLVNSQAEAMFGYLPDELIGKSVDSLVPERYRSSHPQKRQLFFEEPRARAMGAGRELFALRKDGTEVPVEIGLSPIETPNGLVVLSAIVDITERKNAECKLLEADRRKDEFLATLAHELRNPLAPLSNAVDLLRSHSLGDQETGECWEIVSRQLSQLGRLVDDLLDVARITRNKIVLRREVVDFVTIISRALDSSRSLLEEAGHELRIELPPDPVWIDADELRMTQVVANLLNNAIRYTEPRGVITLSCGTAGGSVEFRIRDTGIGIAPAMLPCIFDMFIQADTSLSRQHGGLGIGLSLVKTLVELHGGTVKASSDGAGLGSEFVVHLPTSTIPASTEPFAENDIEELEYTALPRHRVLVVDDMPASAHLVARLLALLEQDVVTAHSGNQALEVISRTPPNIVISDIAMKGMDGYELARRVRENVTGSNITLVALTGFGQENDRERALTAGFDHHLVKPVTLETLRQLVIHRAPRVPAEMREDPPLITPRSR